MNRDQILLALTKYEFQWLLDNPEHIGSVCEFFANGGFAKLTDDQLIERCKDNPWIEG